MVYFTYQDSYSLQMGLPLSYQVHFQQLETIEKILPSSVITQEALNKESVYLVFIIFLSVGSSTSYTYPVTLFYESFLTSLLLSFFLLENLKLQQKNRNEFPCNYHSASTVNKFYHSSFSCYWPVCFLSFFPVFKANSRNHVTYEK